MELRTFITIPLNNSYGGRKEYKIGKILKLVKDPSNAYDSEAICAVSLYHDKPLGYVANSISTVYTGTISSGRLYDRFDDYLYAMVIFITRSSVIASVLNPEEVDGEDIRELEYLDSGIIDPFYKTK